MDIFLKRENVKLRKQMLPNARWVICSGSCSDLWIIIVKAQRQFNPSSSGTLRALPPSLYRACAWLVCWFSTAPDHLSIRQDTALLRNLRLGGRFKMRLSVAFRYAHRSQSSIRRSRAGVKVLNPASRFIPDNSAVSCLWVRESSTGGTTETVASFKSHPRKNDGPLYESAVG